MQMQESVKRWVFFLVRNRDRNRAVVDSSYFLQRDILFSELNTVHHAESPTFDDILVLDKLSGVKDITSLTDYDSDKNWFKILFIKTDSYYIKK